MSESTTLREAIARAIYESDSLEDELTWDELADAPDGLLPATLDYLNNADAVLAVLADPPADVIEQAAKGIDPDAFTMTRDEYRSLYGAFPAGARMTAKGEVKAAFRAAFGGEQDD